MKVRRLLPGVATSKPNTPLARVKPIQSLFLTLLNDAEMWSSDNYYTITLHFDVSWICFCKNRNWTFIFGLGSIKVVNLSVIIYFKVTLLWIHKIVHLWKVIYYDTLWQLQNHDVRRKTTEFRKFESSFYISVKITPHTMTCIKYSRIIGKNKIQLKFRISISRTIAYLFIMQHLLSFLWLFLLMPTLILGCGLELLKSRVCFKDERKVTKPKKPSLG